MLNGIVSGYFDFAEVQAMRHNPMYMSDYVEHLDNVLETTGEKLLTDSGKVSHARAIEKAKREYRKYTVQNLSPVEEEYLRTIKEAEKKVKEGKRCTNIPAGYNTNRKGNKIRTEAAGYGNQND